MEKRPQIKLIATQSDKRLDTVGLLLLAFLWGLAAYYYSQLPSRIPTHFDFFGKANATGKKETLFILPGFGTAIYIALSYICKIPHLLNYPIPINTNNAEQLYRISVRMLRLLKLSILIVFCLVLLLVYLNGTGNTDGIGIWFVPLVMLLVFAPVVWGIRAFLGHK
jgi:uncharacterized membrane protein